MKMGQVRLIESPENKLFKSWMKLHESHGVKKSGQFLLSGKKLVEEAIKKNHCKVLALVTCEGHDSPSEHPTYELKKKLFRELDVLGTGGPLLIGEVPPVNDWSGSLPGPKLFLGLQDPGNLGSALRLASAFAIPNVILLKEAAHPFLPKALRAAAGSTFHLKLWWGPSINELKPHEDLYVLDLNGQSVSEFRWPKDFSLLLGEEGRGLPDSLKRSSHSLTVPFSGRVESLNATHALAITLSAYFQAQAKK
jgi:RNA methyltransferase, TrmH family